MDCGLKDHIFADMGDHTQSFNPCFYGLWTQRKAGWWTVWTG